MDANQLLDAMLARRLDAEGRGWLERALEELARGVDRERFGALLSLASRHARRGPLAPEHAERAALQYAAEGLDCERWTVLEALRVRLAVAHRDRGSQAFVDALEHAFRFADEGELCALYRSLALHPAPERFAWRGGEGCRSNMRSVFEAAACDTPFPARCFDEVAFRQAVLKAIFVGAPVERIQGLARRRDDELARMALDLADERRSAGRPVPAGLWHAVDRFGGARAIESLEREAADAGADPTGRAAARALLERRRLAGVR